MIYFDKVTKVYRDNSAALNNVSFTVEPGEFVSVVGHSGAGKSTLLKVIIAEERPTSGKVFFNSTDVHRLASRYIPHLRRRIGSVFQDFRLLPQKTVFENIAFVMETAVSSKTSEHSMPAGWGACLRPREK
jgi:cell division transport system ATP-binding protein